ncbi:hypothetical protein ACP70R_020710 [Stipagrostis hirtigluma subsp. patula]
MAPAKHYPLHRVTDDGWNAESIFGRVCASSPTRPSSTPASSPTARRPRRDGPSPAAILRRRWLAAVAAGTPPPS